MLRCLRLCALVLGVLCGASAQSATEVVVTPAWSGWTRPGRTTEVDVRLRSGAATQAALTLSAGRQTVRTELSLEAGRVMRLHVPVNSVERLAVTIELPGTIPEQRDVVIAQSEAPLLGVGLAADAPVSLDGFHVVRLDSQALPRHASAYSSIDALILDAPTLAALDSRQLNALLEHTAACGRIVLVSPDPRPRQVLESAAGCGGHALMTASAPAQAVGRLKASLRVPVKAPASLAGLGDLGRFDDSNWHRVIVLLSVYFAFAVLVVMFISSMWMLLVPALATLVIWFTLYGMQPESQLLVWGEAESGSRVARYQAWQQFAGLARTNARVPVSLELGSVRPCDSSLPVRFDFDGARQVITFAQFDARLFQRVLLCYSGDFPAMRDIVIDTLTDGALDVRNAGTHAWSSGVLVTGSSAHELPALAPGEKRRISIRASGPQPDAAARAALSRTQVGHYSALWKQAVGNASDSSVASTTWLLVSVPSP